MNLEASGPEPIRAAFSTAIATTSERADDLTAIAAVLGEADDRYETLHMCASTLGHLRDSAAAFTAAAAALSTARHLLQAALGDFNTRDGHVADAVAETGNLMQLDETAATTARVHLPQPPHEREGKAMNPDDALHTAGSQPRRPGSTPDPLRVAERLVLRDGEQFAGSASVTEAGIMVLAAAVDTPAGRQVHLGVPIFEEERRQSRGAHAPARETVVDEDGEECGVDTGADSTVILDAADAARLGALADDVIARATAADKEFRQLRTDYDRLYAQRVALEAGRFPDPIHGEKLITLEFREAAEVTWQRRRRRFLDECAARLDPANRATYHALQEQIDAAGREVWESGRDEQAAAVCGLSVAEFHELQQLKATNWRTRTQAQRDRLVQLDHDGRPPLLEQQAALVCGLSIDELREMRRLERIGRARRRPHEQARLDELDASPRGATAATPRQTVRMRGRYLAQQDTHHASKGDLARTRRELAELRATARPLDPATAAELDRVTADLAVVSDRHEQMAGASTASAQIPARHGGSLVIDAVQQEDGGVEYQLDRKPATAAEDWSPGDNGEPFTTTAAGLRKVAKLAVSLAQRDADDT
jgi:hypothetical protein